MSGRLKEEEGEGYETEEGQEEQKGARRRYRRR